MRDPEVALDVLAGKGDAHRTQLCVCCLFRDNDNDNNCPFPKDNRPYGLCRYYTLDELNVSATLARVLAHLVRG